MDTNKKQMVVEKFIEEEPSSSNDITRAIPNPFKAEGTVDLETPVNDMEFDPTSNSNYNDETYNYPAINL